MIEASEFERAAPPGEVPSGTPFSCDVSFFDEHAVVAVRGELDLATAPVVLREALATLALPIETLTLDLGRTTFLDSSGLGVLLQAQHSAQERGISVEVVSVSSQVRQVIDITGVGDLLAAPRDQTS